MSEGSRRLVAVLFSDIVGYTAAMGRDEHRAIDAVSRARATQRTLIDSHRGRWIQTVGDGVLCTFESAVDAAGCALEIQQRFGEGSELRLRIGIHVGDVVFLTDDEQELEILGDGVNVASRIHALAEPGQVCVSERVYEELKNHPEIGTRPLGVRRLKNVARPVRVHLLLEGAARERGFVTALLPRIGRRVWTTLALVIGLVVAGSWLLEGGSPQRLDEPTEAGPAEPLRAVPAAPPTAAGGSPVGAEPPPIARSPTRTPAAAPGPTPGGASAEVEVSSSAPPTAGEPQRAIPGPAATPAQPPPLREPVGAPEPQPTPVGAAPPRSGDAESGSATPVETSRALDTPPVTEPAPEAPDPPPPGPREVIAQTIDEILEILRGGRPTRARLRRIEHLAYTRFDLETFSRLVLGDVNRARFSRAEFEEFVREFEALLTRYYSQKIARYEKEDVEVLGTVEHPRGDVSVETRIVGGRHDGTRVDYRLRRRRDRWMVIDVTIDGVTLLSHYSVQFDSVLRRGKASDLLVDVRRRNAEGLAHGRESPERQTTPFELARKALLEAPGRWPTAAARLWAEPNPVGVGETYKVSFEAACDCSAALFAIHDSAQAITLLYPTAKQKERLAPSVPRDVVAAPRSKANPAEGVATEILLLLVSSEAIPIPASTNGPWVATPRASKRLEELQAFVDWLGRTSHDSAVAYLRVVE